MKNFIWIVLLLGYCFAEPKALFSQSPTVLVETVKSVKRLKSFITKGDVSATNSTNIKTQIDGRVVKILAKSGSKVAKGDVLLELSNAKDTANLHNAQAEFKNAKWVLEQTVKLHKTNSTSDLELEDAQRNFSVTKANVAMYAAILQDKFVAAPFDGTIGVIKPQVGDYLLAGTEVAKIEGPREVFVDFLVPQVFGNKINSKMKIKLYSNLNQNVAIDAKVIAVDSGLDDNKQLLVRAEVEIAPEWLITGSFVSVSIPIGDLRSVVLVPETAVVYNSGSSSVFVLGEDNKVENRLVELGDLAGNGLVEVVKGLVDGDQLVTLGGFKLYNGQEVKVSQ